jgi:DNA-binding XRE family transcriptional regulator
MRNPHKRAPPGPRLEELIRLRQEKFPALKQRDIAKLLGITRLHMTAVETGRRPASLELAVRWLNLLRPEAKVWMFGPLPVAEEKIRTFKKLQKIAPEFFRAA